MNSKLYKKYSTQAPRYTSYPAVPLWEPELFNLEIWKQKTKAAFFETNQTDGISLYIHLPYCESLCTYCACNTRITVNHWVEKPYVLAVLKEWAQYLDLFEDTPRIKELHLGGGTPTFFSPENLKNLIEGISSASLICKDALFSFEGHPSNTTAEHLSVLAEAGFKRISLGIQDFDEEVQKKINRHQDFEQVKDLTELSRSFGYDSVNFDLVYGLPLQTEDSVKQTIQKVLELKPDRIAYYSYAHVPWIRPAQMAFKPEELPDDKLKAKLHEIGRKLFLKHKYKEIGMDHFAADGNELLKAKTKGNLHRNFMGYTQATTKLLIGLGVSSISDCFEAFAQNTKVVEDYLEKTGMGEFPIIKGHKLTKNDQILRRHIANLMCYGNTTWKNAWEQCEPLYEGLIRLLEMENDGLVIISANKLQITKTGLPFLRNICMMLDERINTEKKPTHNFSKTF